MTRGKSRSVASPNSLSSDRLLSWVLCLTVLGCAPPDYQVGQSTPTGGTTDSSGSRTKSDGGAQSSSAGGEGGSSAAANTGDARSDGGNGGRSYDELAYPGGLANLGRSAAGGPGNMSTPTGDAATAGATSAMSSAAGAAGRASAGGSDAGRRAAIDLAGAGSNAIAGSVATSGIIAAAGNITSGGGGTGSQHQAGAGGGAATGGTLASGGRGGSAGNAAFACASYTDLGTFPSKSSTEQAVPIGATCYRFTVSDLMSQVQGMGIYGCDTRKSAINGIDCTTGCSASLPIERAPDGFWYVEFDAGRSSSCKAQWWWY